VTIGHTWQAFSRDAGYQLSGGLPILSAKGVRRHVGVDTCELVTPYSPDAYGRMAPACGVVVERDGVQQFSGMVGSSRKIGWDADSGDATITVQLLGDDQHLADRLVWPSPTSPATGQVDNYWTYTGPASSAMWRLINEQAGPAAQASRRVPTLVMGPDPVLGVSRLWAEQFATVLDTLDSWGRVSGADLGVRVVTTGDGLRADLYAPRDLTAGVRFSASLSNLTGWEYEQTPPTVTFAIAAGQGDLAGRTRRSRQSINAADLAWGRRIEQYVDQRDEADPTKLQTSADDTIAQGIGTTALSTTAADTPAATYGTDWDLGDRVTVYVGLPQSTTASTVADVVREVGFEVDSTGAEKIVPAVGSPDAVAVPLTPVARAQGRTAKAVRRLTRNQ
jgi:hypothetical protein